MPRSLSLLGFALSLFLGVCGSALAQPAPQQTSGKDEEARGLFWAGRAAYDEGRYKDALGYFSRSYQLSGRPELLYNIGQTADRLRKDQEALDAFTEYLNRVPNADHREAVEARIVLLREGLEEREEERLALAARAAPAAVETEEAAKEPATPAAPEPEAKQEPAAPAVVSNENYTGGSDAPAERDDGSIWSKWWLWTAVGAVVAAGVVIGVVAASGKDTTKAPDKVGTGVVFPVLRMP